MVVRATCAFAGLFAAAPGIAQSQATERADIQLDQIVVTASRADTALEAMPQYTTIITQEDIRRSPAQTLDQLLRNVPGFNLTGVPAAQSDPTGHQTRMRGLGNAKVLVLLDGVPIHDPFYLTTQWFKVPLTNIERVEVIRGGSSSLWGNMAVAGVVNIISKRPADNSGEAVASAGDQGTIDLAYGQNFKFSDALRVNVAIDQYQTQGYQQTPPDALWRFPGKGPVGDKNTNAQFTAFFRPSADLSGYLRAGYHIQDQDISYQFGNNLQKSPDISGSVTKVLNPASRITVNGWAQSVHFEKFNGASCYAQPSGTLCPASTSVTMAQINGNILQYYTQYGSQHYRERGGSAVYSTSLPGSGLSSIQIGADYRRLAATDLEFFYLAPVSLNKLQNLNSSAFGEGAQTFTGLFAQAKAVPVDALEVTLSGRFDRLVTTDRTNTRTTAAGMVSGGPIADSSASAFSPGVGAHYDLNDFVSLRSAAYKAFRAPGFNNITRTFGTGTGTTIANPDLRPESLKGWEMGTDFRSERLTVGLTYFHYDITNQIATYTVNANSANIPAQVTAICGPVVGGAFPLCSTTSAATSVKFYTNDQDGRSTGIELVGTWRALSNLSFNAAYTHNDTYLTRRGSIVTDPLNVQLTGVPWNTALVGATWEPRAGLRIYAEARYVGQMPYDTTSVPGTTFVQGGFTVLNASATYAWSKQVDLTASVINLTNKEYSENAYTFNQPFNRTLSMPRTFTAGLRVRF